MSVFQVRVNWGGPSSPLLTTHFFDGADLGGAQGAADAVDAFWTSISSIVGTAFSWDIDTEVRELDHVTGALLNVFGVTGGGQFGTLVGEPLDLLQGLIVWRTGMVVDGRLLKGRTFVPGPSEGANDFDATPTPGYVSAAAAPITALIGHATSKLVVWHRPKFDPETGDRIRDGSFATVTSGGISNQWSYLRSRRR